MKKQLYIVTKPTRGGEYGIGTYLKQLALLFQDNADWELIFMHFRSEVSEFALEEKDNIRYIKIPEKLNPYRAESEEQGMLYLRAALTVLNVHMEVKEDSVFLLNYVYRSYFVDLLKEFFPTCKTVSVIHYMNWMFSLGGNTTRFKRIINGSRDVLTDSKELTVWDEFQKERTFLQQVDHILSLSQYTSSLLTDCYCVDSSHISLVYNGLVDEYKEYTEDELKALRDNYFIDRDEFILLFVGRLDKIKGLSYLIEAFKRIIKVMPNSRLLVVGEGDFSTYVPMASSICNKITWVGKVDKNVLYDFYKLANLGVIASKHEQCSYVAIEMMMHGLPIVGTDSTGLKEMLPCDKYKVHLQEEDKQLIFSSEELAKVIIDFFEMSQHEKNAYRKMLRDHYEKVYHIDIMKEKTLSVLYGLFINNLKTI